jgi:hypothetical protein
MLNFSNISATAFLIADPTRAVMLTMLMDGARTRPGSLPMRRA